MGKQKFGQSFLDSVPKLNRFVRISMAVLVLLFLSIGCNNQGASSTGKSTALTNSNGSVTGNATVSNETQCLVFQNNTKDYATCLSCKKSLCSCASAGNCTNNELAACSVNFNTLTQCVHSNVSAAGGICLGLTCGSNQIADFNACLCRDANPPTSIGAQPGYEDPLTPYVEPGFFLLNRYCKPGTPSTIAANNALDLSCLYYSSGEIAGTHKKVLPVYQNATAANVFQDTGYIRWDLALDASQFPPGRFLANGLYHPYTNATIPATLSLYYQLKPNTKLSSSTTKWQDCAEHFSGYDTGGSSAIHSNVQCDSRTGSVLAAATAAIDVPLVAATGFSGTSRIENLSMNGTSSNPNLLLATELGNAGLDFSLGTNITSPNHARGLAKQDSAASINNGIGTLASTGGAGLFSNIGTYKYSWGPVSITSTTQASKSASATVSGRVSINANLGFNPASIVESTAASPVLTGGAVATRDCTVTNLNPHPCVSTAVYRTSGGSILSQSFSPYWATRNHSSAITPLPGGIVAVSTPKIIEDVSQESLTSTQPARLRTFVRASDGNIYMSRFESGSWNAWMSLGRPWSCNAAQTNCSNLISGTNSIAKVYQPFNIGGSFAADDGISIVGEPVVTSWVDRGTAAGSPAKQIIVVIARVSHLQSSTGTEPTASTSYHNGLFFTMAVADTAYNSGTRTFDNPHAWTKWLPVSSGAFKIQGNPIALIRASGGDTGANPTLFLMATSSANDGGANLLHPPIAPPSSSTHIAAAVLNNGNTNNNLTARYWHNYGNKLITTSLNLAGGSTANIVNGSWTPATPAWSATQTYSGDIDAGTYSVFTSDWSFSPVEDLAGSLTNYTRIRLFVNEIYHKNCAYGTPASACDYERRTRWIELNLTAGSGTTSNCGSTGAGAPLAASAIPGKYERIDFIGTPQPVNFLNVTNAINANPNSTSIVRPSNKLYLFGRAYCPNKNRCDPVNTYASYAAVKADSECTGTTSTPQLQNHYYYGGATSETSAADTVDLSTISLQSLPISSDATVIHSHALQAAGNDMPAYILFRNAQGNLSIAIWAGYNNINNSTSGSGFPFLQIFNVGGAIF